MFYFTGISLKKFNAFYLIYLLNIFSITLLKTRYYIISQFLSTLRPILNPKPLNLFRQIYRHSWFIRGNYCAAREAIISIAFSKSLKELNFILLFENTVVNKFTLGLFYQLA